MSQKGGRLNPSTFKERKLQKMLKPFDSLPKWAQILLMAIPGVNALVDFIQRLLLVIDNATGKNIVGMILTLLGPVGVVVAYIDLIMMLSKKEFILVEKK